MKIAHFFKYKYNISLLFISTIVMSMINGFQFINKDIAGFIIMHSIFIVMFAWSLKYKLERKKLLSRYNAYEKISKWTLFILTVSIVSTLFSIAISLNLLPDNDFITKYNEKFSIIPALAIIIYAISNIDKYIFLLMFSMNPDNLMALLNDDDSINTKIEKELKKTSRMFNDKSIEFEHNVRHRLADIVFFVDKNIFISFNVLTKSKMSYKIDHTFFYYGKHSFKKVELYNYLKSANLKLDMMSNEDWKVAEMYLIS